MKNKKENRLNASLTEKEREINALEEVLNSTKTLDELKERENELRRQNKEDRVVIQNDNTTPLAREAAEARVAKRNETLARLQTQVEELERVLPLRERIKEIFKKISRHCHFHPFGSRRHDRGCYCYECFESHGQSFWSRPQRHRSKDWVHATRAEHTWLLILAVVAFLFEITSRSGLNTLPKTATLRGLPHQ